jgi:Domain of Unknown Function with PDB structure (DUF3857)
MAKILGLLVIICGLTEPAISQLDPIKFGDISMEDMRMKTEETDSSAGAMMLMNFGEIFPGIWGENFLENHLRIKILSKKGFRFANMEIPFSEAINIHEAATFNLVGDKIVETKLTQENIFIEKNNLDYYKYRLAFPDVHEGSVLEFSYNRRYAGLPNWEFQKSMPVRRSEVWFIVSRSVVGTQFLHGYRKPDFFEEQVIRSKGTTYNGTHWVMTNLSAFRDEVHTSNPRDYISKVDFFNTGHHALERIPEKINTWSTITQETLDNFNRISKAATFSTRDIHNRVSKIDDPLKKIEAIRAYVTQNVIWNNVFWYRASNLDEAFKSKKGTSAEINLILAYILVKEGFLVDLILISTRHHGVTHPEIPTMDQFNYILCSARVNGKPILIDATDKYLPADILPEHCLNGKGFMVSELTPAWIDISSKVRSKKTVGCELILGNDGELKGELQIRSEGYDAASVRKSYAALGEENYLKIINTEKNLEIEKSEFQDLDKPNVPIKEFYQVIMNRNTQVSRDIIYLDPIITSRDATNPFSQPTREFPIDFGAPFEKTYSVKITLPTDYVVDELPQSKILKLPDDGARFTYNATQVSNVVSVTCDFKINKYLFAPEEYANLREFFTQAVAKQSEQIVLRKKQ